MWDEIQTWTISSAIRGEYPGTEWLFPIVETIHVIALTLVFGTIAMVDTRLLGFGQGKATVSGLTAELLPWTWKAWFVAAVFGTLMFMSKAVTYAGNIQFQLKFVCMALAGINMVIFHIGAFRKIASWDNGKPPLSAKLAGALSLTFWTGVIFFGRWAGFTT